MMVKSISFFVAMLMTVTNVFAASSSALEELFLYNKNYTADYTTTVTFENTENVIALLEEMEIPEEISYFVDMKMLLKSMLSYDGKMTVHTDIGENYDKMKVGFVSDGNHNIDLNPNLNANITAKFGLWMDLDLSNEEKPVFNYIMSLPFMNRYMKFDAVEFMGDEEIAMLRAMYNKEYMEAANSQVMESYKKYADIVKENDTYTIKFDNEGLISCVAEYASFISSGFPTAEENGNQALLAFFEAENLKLLGENGLSYRYTVKNGQIESGTVEADVLIDLESIYFAVSGEEWPFDAKGELKFTLNSEMNLSDIGSTKVEFPVLTEENTFPMEKMMPDSPSAELEEWSGYPMPYLYLWCENIPVIDGEIYLPLRLTLEEAYGDKVEIGYQNGVVSAKSELFPEFENLTITINSDKVYADEKEHIFTKAILLNDRTYVNSKIFAELFGWELWDAQYNMMTDEYSYYIDTMPYEE